MKSKKKTKIRIELTVVALIAIILMTQIIPHIKAEEEEDPPLEYLFLSDPTPGNHSFRAKGECYLFADIDNTDFVYVELDEEEYELSYGINTIPVEFSEILEEHTISLPDSTSICIKSLAIEPLFLAEGNINTTLDEQTEIIFEAGGLVSLLIQTNFSYNWVYVEADGMIYKNIYPTNLYPEIDSQFYSYFVDQGAYCRFDLFLEPGTHELKLMGNGSLKYKIVVNSDWDEDQLSDVYEIQNEQFSNLDPVNPDIWGFFQKSKGEIYWNNTEDPVDGKKEGLYNFFIPSPGHHSLIIDVYNGEFSDFAIDGNSSILKDTLTANYPITSINSNLVNISDLNPGWHFIEYYFQPGFSNISFRINGVKIKSVTPLELVDSDGDGIKDVDEVTSTDSFDIEDTDKDGLPDTFDISPLASMILNKDNITQLLMPTSRDKNSIITIQVKRSENDYSTNGIPRFWRDDLNVSITAVMRLFGNQFQFNKDSPIEPLTKDKLTYLWGKELSTYSLFNKSLSHLDVGDALPPPSNPNNETYIIHPMPTSEGFEYQIKFPKDHPAKDDEILDLRFDIIWVVTSYTVENGTTLLHYYDFEENLTVQSIVHREIADINYIIGAPDDFVENQVLWALTQNQDLGSPEDYDLSQDIIGQGTSDYFDIGGVILSDIDDYYLNHEPDINETQVLYISGLYDTRDILSDINTIYNPEADPTLFGTMKVKQYLSFYSINDVYSNYNYGENQLDGECISLYNTYYNNLTTLVGIPIEIEVKNLPNTKILTILEASSDVIRVEEIPRSKTSALNDTIILKNKTYIIRKKLDEPVPTLNFIQGVDEFKTFINIRSDQIESAKSFFDNNSLHSSQFTMYNYYMDLLNSSLGTLHEGLKFFQSPEGQQQYGDEIYDIFRDFSDFLDIYIDTGRTYLISLEKCDVHEKLDYLELIQVGLEKFSTNLMFLDKVLKLFDDRGEEIKGVISKFITESKWGKKIIDTTKNALKKAGSGFWSGVKRIAGFFGYKSKPKTKSHEINTAKIFSIISMGINLGFLLYHISEAVKLVQDSEAGKYLNKTGAFLIEVIKSFGSIALDIIAIIGGTADILKICGHISYKSLKSVTKFVTYVTLIISIILTILDWGTFINEYLSGELANAEFVVGLTMLIYETIVLIGITICVVTGKTVIGAIIGGIVIALTFLSALLAPFINNVDFNIVQSASGFFFPEETELNMRRHGGLEQGDILNFKLRGIIIGQNYVWIRSRFKLEGDDWTGAWTSWQGRWSHILDRYYLYDLYTASFHYPILAPTTDIKYRLSFQLDIDQLIILFLPPFFLWIRTAGSREIINDSLGIPALEKSISEFYNHTTEIMSTEQLKQNYHLALEEYRYKDAYDTATEIITRTRGQAEVIPSQLDEIIDRRQEYNETHFKLRTLDINEFMELIDNHFSEGFRAETLIPDSERGSVSSNEIKYLHMISYSYSNGTIVFPKEWIYDKLEELGDAELYEQYREELPLRTNIFLNLEGEILDLDLSTGKIDVEIPFLLEGPDNPLVNIILETSDEFLVSNEFVTQYLGSNLTFTLESKSQTLYAGVYKLNLTVFLEDILIFHKKIPFRIQAFSCLTLEVNIPEIPINPGDIINLVNVTNRGTIEENLELKIEGIPEDFIYTGLYPEVINNFTQYFSVMQGETRQCLVINPPRFFTTIPGEYTYTVTLKDIYTNEIKYLFEGSFVIAEFYELAFQCLNPVISILDNETCAYYFTITNLGNTEEDFNVAHTYIGIASSYLDKNTIILAPGQTQFFVIKLDPLKIGSQAFFVTVASEHISKIILALITISDDDVVPPILSDLIIEDDILNVYVSLKVLDQSDIDYFRIYVDGVLIEPQSFSRNGDYYSFVLNNEWILLYGIHEIDIYVTDADDDRAFDNLTSSISGLFEISLDQMYEYVDWQIEVLKEFVEENTYCSVSRYLNKKLSQAQTYLHKTLEYCESGEITCGLWKAYIAKLFLRTAEHKTEIYNKISWIDEYIAGIIINSMREIRNNIVILMGVSTDPEIGYEIALTKIELLNLYDLVEHNISRYYRSSLNNYIREAAKDLETALFKLSMDINPNCSFSFAQWKLDKAIWKVNWLLDKGKISQELADILIEKITQICLAIEDLKYLI